LRTPSDGRLKLFVTQTLLRLRRANEEFFREAQYVPLAAFGDQRDHVLCFARTTATRVMIVAVGRFYIGLNCREALPVGDQAWQDSAIVLPSDVQGTQFRDVLSGRMVRPAVYRGRSLMPLSEVFADLPAAVLELV
jgi:(1->4)-alpha-D-glucan 1-alpha-D-glucosylmutase